jgi:CheY-like chemotaxis protein
MSVQVLVIEDNYVLCRLVTDVLTFAGYEPASAASGDEALALLQTRSGVPDVILCDFHLPDMTGCEVFARLHAAPKWNSIPFILLSGETELLTPCGNFQMVKPFMLQTLLSTIEQALHEASSF